MPVITAPHEFNENELFVDLRSAVGHSLYLKCEGFNFAGSVKLKAATAMVESAEREGRLRPGSVLVESSSGNLGVALSTIAASKGYGFVCVTDSKCNLQTRLLMEALGAEVLTVTEPDPIGGLLAARLNCVRALCASDPRYVWLNQYENDATWQAHYATTGPAIAQEFPDLDVLFVGAGTTGTLMGCARYFRQWHPSVRIVAVDPVGSVSFGTPAAPRMIPGLGMAVRPPMLDESFIDEVVHVEEADAIRTCHGLARTRVPVRWLHGHRGQRGDALAGPPRRPRPHRGRHRPGLGRALPRHRLPHELGAGPLRRRRAPRPRGSHISRRLTVAAPIAGPAPARGSGLHRKRWGKPDVTDVSRRRVLPQPASPAQVPDAATPRSTR